MNTFATTALRGLAVGAVLSVLSTAVLSGAASAETSVFSDARGDLAHGADIHRVRVVNDDRVEVRVVHRDLVRSYRAGSSMSVFLDTDRDRKGPEYVFLAGTFEGADYALVRADGWNAASRTAVPMRCGYDMGLDYVKDVAHVRIDRACLDRPRAVRVEVKTGGESSSGGTAVDWLGNPRHFARWVDRG